LNSKPRLLIVGNECIAEELPSVLREKYELISVNHPLRALVLARSQVFSGVYFSSAVLSRTLSLVPILEKNRILDGMPDGVAVVDEQNTILWANRCLQTWAPSGNIVGENFYKSLGTHLLGPDQCPFTAARHSGHESSALIRTEGNKHFNLHAVPIVEANGQTPHIIVTVRDVTTEILQQQKLAAIHKAGEELANLSAEELTQMSIEDRVELLKSNILHFTKDLLNFDVVEIRLREESNKLAPLLAVGLDQEAMERELYALPEGNGVTGFVAATGKSYLCEDTSADPLFLEGFAGSKSSLTVPLILHDKVIGTFNVESPQKKAFSESDLQFLEIFSRDVAVALNTLELLVAQKATALQEGVEAIHSAVAMPIDVILNDAVHVMERYVGHDPEVVERVQRILRNARDIKQVIQKVGREMSPAEAVPCGVQLPDRPKLVNKRILVVDAEATVRSAAHCLLERYDCAVETAQNGEEAIIMVRNSLRDVAYDIIISAIHLPDMSGSALMERLRTLIDPVPMILMTGFGYDPGHSIVKARQMGMHPQAVLYKPFRLDQLLTVIETVLEAHRKVPATS
jgi:two-component system, sensor histidine kinase SagS